MSSPVRCLILLLVLTPAINAIAQRSRADTVIIHFAFNRSDIRQADSAVLVQAGQNIGSGQNVDSILVLGYTDTAGTDVYNQKLSYRRALAAQTTLRHFALTPPIRLDPRGESNPLSDDSLSRRVEIIFYLHQQETAKAPPVDTPRIKPDDEPDTVFALNNINFIANTPILTDAAKNAMPKSVAYLKTFASHYLEIDGFCNQPGPLLDSREPLFILSVQRAKFIYDYLITQGFDSTHLRYKGMGNATPMVAHPTTAAEMDQNMRVEIKVFRKPQPQPQAQIQQ